MTRLPESSKPERDVYEVEMRSLEGEILRGYWAVPTDGQSHPAVVVYQGYDAVTWIPGEFWRVRSYIGQNQPVQQSGIC